MHAVCTHVIFPNGWRTVIRSVSLQPSATARQWMTHEGGVLWCAGELDVTWYEQVEGEVVVTDDELDDWPQVAENPDRSLSKWTQLILMLTVTIISFIILVLDNVVKKAVLKHWNLELVKVLSDSKSTRRLLLKLCLFEVNGCMHCPSLPTVICTEELPCLGKFHKISLIIVNVCSVMIIISIWSNVHVHFQSNQ